MLSFKNMTATDLAALGAFAEVIQTLSDPKNKSADILKEVAAEKKDAADLLKDANAKLVEAEKRHGDAKEIEDKLEAKTQAMLDEHKRLEDVSKGVDQRDHDSRELAAALAKREKQLEEDRVTLTHGVEQREAAAAQITKDAQELMDKAIAIRDEYSSKLEALKGLVANPAPTVDSAPAAS